MQRQVPVQVRACCATVKAGFPAQHATDQRGRTPFDVIKTENALSAEKPSCFAFDSLNASIRTRNGGLFKSCHAHMATDGCLDDTDCKRCA
jgi:hypothetical protein